MKLHLVILLLLFSATSFAQYSLTASIGVGTADARSNKSDFLGGVYIADYKSLTGAVTFLHNATRTIKIGGALSFQQYIIKSVGGGGPKGWFSMGDRIELDDNDSYIFVGPVGDLRIFKFLYLDIEPALGILLKSSEKYGIGDTPTLQPLRYTGVQHLLFQFGISLREPIRVTKHWKVVLSESFNISPSTLTNTRGYDNTTITSNFASLQIGVMRSYPKRKRTTDQ